MKKLMTTKLMTAFVSKQVIQFYFHDTTRARSHVWHCQPQDHNKPRQHLSAFRSHAFTHAAKGLLWAHQLNNTNPHQVDKQLPNQQIKTWQKEISQLTQSSIIRYSVQVRGVQLDQAEFICERRLACYSSSFTSCSKQCRSCLCGISALQV